MLKRILSEKLVEASRKFPVVAVTGPRQAGKTTLVKHTFSDKPYVSLEDPDVRNFALSDPRGLLARHPDGMILDEVQRAPNLLSFIQTIVDESRKNGLFILTGSHNLLLLESISQTLAGRIRILNLLPFAVDELRHSSLFPSTPESVIFQGFYPPLYDQRIEPSEWYPGYVETYVERDVRMIKNIENLDSFRLFTRICAGRIAQTVNLSSIGNDCGITHNTAKSWLGILRTAFLVFLVQPYFKNFRKRLTKSPKLYFYDTGLASSLLGIENARQVETHPLRGALFENMVVSEIIKRRFNLGKRPNLYYWRDKTGREVDCILDRGTSLDALEIKAGRTVSFDMFRNLISWKNLAMKNLAMAEEVRTFLVHAGDMSFTHCGTEVLPWNDLGPIGET